MLGKRQRLTFLIDSMQERAGTERVTASVANGLSARGHDVQILTLRGEESAFELAPQVRLWSLHRTHETGALRLRGEAVGLIRDIRRHMQSARPHTLIVVDTLLSIFAYPAIWGLHCQHIAWEHFHFHTHFDLRSRKLARQLAAYMGHGVVTLTEQDAVQWRRALPGARARIQAIANPLSFQTTVNAYDPASRTVLAVGRLGAQKGFDLLLQAWAQVEPHAPEWSLRIIGSGKDEAALRALAASLGVQRWVLEPVTSDVRAAFATAGVFCLSSRHEGLPMVLMESQADGVPAVAFDCQTGPADLLATGGGLLVPPANVQALAESLRHLMGDETLRLEQSRRAFKGVRRYDLAAILDQWEMLVNRSVSFNTHAHPGSNDSLARPS